MLTTLLVKRIYVSHTSLYFFCNLRSYKSGLGNTGAAKLVYIEFQRFRDTCTLAGAIADIGILFLTLTL